jgi:MraZ protein
MLSGTAFLSVDDKNRILVPDRFRFEMSEEFVITRGFDKCLFAFPYDDWLLMVGERRGATVLDKQSVLWERWFISSAVKTKCDSQGRLTIPEHLRVFAQIGLSEGDGHKSAEVALCGSGNRLEIWALHRWRAYLDQVNEDDLYEAVAQVTGRRGVDSPTGSG